MGNMSQLCHSGSDQETRQHDNLETTILHNRKQCQELPPVPEHVEQKMAHLFPNEALLSTNSKIWEVEKPKKFYYFNEALNKDSVPMGQCAMYFFHPNNRFKGVFRGNISTSGSRESKGSVYVLDNGDYFIGDKQRADYGTFISESDQYQYQGDWVNGKAHGLGREVAKRGAYEGYYLNGKKHGQGRLTNCDGFTYEGNFNNNEIDGNGRYENKKQNYEYVGQFKNGMKSGHGVEKTSEYQYEGNFRNNCKSGVGKIWFKNKEVEYEGEFEDNMAHGRGKMRHGGQVTEGIWEEGKLRAIFPVSG